MTLGSLIRELGKRRGDGTWAMLAAEIGCSTSNLCDVLRGHRRPGKKILEFLGFKAETVYVSNGAKIPGSHGEGGMKTRRFRGKADTENGQ